ncbi:MAG: sensor histidine kinase, partial [Calditrichaeota bacterium]
RREGDSVEITIRDNGKGIPEEVQGKIFDPFFTTKPVGQGTGLGLSISYNIVRNHGGTIRVSSKPGEGAAFTVVLPLKSQREQPEPPAGATP